MRAFGKRVVPNLVLLARHQERIVLRNPNHKLTPPMNSEGARARRADDRRTRGR